MVIRKVSWPSSWAIPLGLGLTVLLASALAAPPSRADDCDKIRAEIRQSEHVVVSAGTYVCSSPIVLDKDGLDFEGAGAGKTIFKLADHANAPVIIIGHASGHEGQPPDQVRHIHASGFSVDGNQKKQEFECWGGPCYSSEKAYVHNNAVTIRSATDVELDHVDLANDRSGGLVTELGCDHLNVHDLKSRGNFYDGIALYVTTHSTFSNMTLNRNYGAGISIDLNLHDNVFKDSLISDNHDVGIFARSAWNNSFDNIRIQNNGSYGVFGAWYGDGQTQSCFRDNTFDDLDVENSKGAAIKLVGKCDGNKVLNSRFRGNSPDSVESDGQTLVVNSGPDSASPCSADETGAPNPQPDLDQAINTIEGGLSSRRPR